MNHHFTIFLSLLALLFQVACNANANEKVILVFGNQFSGETATVEVDAKFKWSGELNSKPELGCAKIVVGNLDSKTFKISITIGKEPPKLENVDLVNGKYLIINFDPKMRLIEFRQTDKRPAFLMEEP